MLVEVVKCSADKFQADFLKDNSLKFVKVAARRFKVQQCRSFFDGSGTFWDDLGVVFTEKNIWVFVPYRAGDHPDRWYFGQTRCDAVSGYLSDLRKKESA